MTVKVAINGFGRMGRLAIRAAWGFNPARADTLIAPGNAWGAGVLDIVHINEPNGSAEMSAHLLAFDSVHGRWPVAVEAMGEDRIDIAGKQISYSRIANPADVGYRCGHRVFGQIQNPRSPGAVLCGRR